MTRPSRSSRQGWSLVELLIASCMALVVAIALITVFRSGLSIERNARESYYISQDSSVALRTLRQDLTATALSCLRVEEDGFSMLSAYPMASTSGFLANRFGAPAWKKSVHYRLGPASKGAATLMRWETEYQPVDGFPRLAPISEVDAPKTAHPLLRNVLGKGHVVDKDPQGIYRLLDRAEAPGGFSLRFVRADGTLSKDNPASYSDKQRPNWTLDNTRLVRLDLQVISDPGDGKVSTLALQMTICPRH